MKITTLLEAQDYESIFNFVKPFVENDIVKEYLVNYPQEIQWAKTHLKKSDRIIWFLKNKKYGYLKYLTTLELPPEFNKLKQKMLSDMAKLESTGFKYPITDRERRSFEHFMSLSRVGKIQNYVFTNKDPALILQEFAQLEREWQQNFRPPAVIERGDKIIIKFGEDRAWWLLPRSGCDNEASAGGHCGNVPTAKSGQRILSYRTKDNEGNWTVWLTFILWENGYLGEMKGANNQKPLPKFYPYIVALLKKSELISGIKGGGYEPENNFQFDDLSDAQQKEVLAANPDIDLTGGSVYALIKAKGATPEVIRAIDSRHSDSNLPSIDGIDADSKTVVLQSWSNLAEFASDYNFDYLENAVNAASREELSDSEISDLADTIDFSSEQYFEVIDRLPDQYLQKLANDLGIRGNISSVLVKQEIADSMKNSKYNYDMAVAMIKSSQIKNIKNEEGFADYIELLLQVVYRSTRSSMMGLIYDINDLSDTVKLVIDLDDFASIVDESFNDSDDAYNEEHYYVAMDVMSANEWFALDSYDLKNNIKDLKKADTGSYSDYSEDDAKLFKKFKSISADENLSGSSFNVNPIWASRYFMRELNFSESEEKKNALVNEYKRLAGLG